MAFPLAAAIGVGISLFDQAQGAANNRAQARLSMDFIDQEIDALNDNREALEDFRQARKEFVSNINRGQFSSLLDSVGIKDTTIAAEQEIGIAKSGLASSGFDNVMERARSALGVQFKDSSRSLADQLSTSFLEIETDFFQKSADLDTRIRQLESERKVAKQQSKQKFLGIF